MAEWGKLIWVSLSTMGRIFIFIEGQWDQSARKGEVSGSRLEILEENGLVVDESQRDGEREEVLVIDRWLVMVLLWRIHDFCAGLSK